MSQFRSLVIFVAGAIAAAACTTTPTSPPQTSTEVTVTPPSATDTAPPADQPLPEPADQPLPEPAAEAGKRPQVPAEPVDHMAAPGFIACTPEARKKACTKESKPVCGVVDTGIRCIRAPCPSTAEQTFGNACTACADSKTSGYRTGACAPPSPQGNKPELQ